MSDENTSTLWEHLSRQLPAIRVRPHHVVDWNNSRTMPFGFERARFDVLERLEEIEVMRVAHDFYQSQNWEIKTSSTGGLRVRPNPEFGEFLTVLVTVASTVMVMTVD